MFEPPSGPSGVGLVFPMGNPWICTLTHGADSGRSQFGADGLEGLLHPGIGSVADVDSGILLLLWTGSSFHVPSPRGMSSQIWITPGVFGVIDLRGCWSQSSPGVWRCEGELQLLGKRNFSKFAFD